jgi:signal transduction histidine kinase
MSENVEMTSKQKKAMREMEFKRKYGRFWLIYVALGFTAVLSFLGGLMLPFMKENVNVPLNWATGAAALFYGLGFLIIGELAANFWLDKITDQDPDNGKQKGVAALMIAMSVIISATTALATSYIIAYWIGVFEAFLVIPVWAQKYIAIVIPIMMVFHAVMAIVFKAVSDEAFAEREANSRINQARSEAAIMKEQAKANYIIANAPRLAREMGEMEAEAELDATRARIAEEKSKRSLPPPANTPPVLSYQEVVRQLEELKSSNGHGLDPHNRQS